MLATLAVLFQANPSPIESPSDITTWFDQVYEAIHTHQYWGLASLLLFGLMYAIKQGSKRLPPTSKLAVFLKSDRGSILTLLVLSLLGGFATAIGHGTKIDMPLVVTAIKAAGGATFVFALIFKLLFPKAAADVLPVAATPTAATTPATPEVK